MAIEGGFTDRLECCWRLPGRGTPNVRGGLMYLVRLGVRKPRRSAPKPLVPRIIFLAALFMAAVPLRPATAATANGSAEDTTPTLRHVVVTKNKSRLIHLNRPFSTAAIGQAAIADVRPMTDRTLYIQGKKIGTTNISIFNHKMQLVEVIDLDVAIDTASLQRNIRESVRTNAVRVRSSNGKVILSGLVPDSVVADRAVSIASSMVPANKVINAMAVAPSQEVMLKVRFLEADRSAERALGINWFVTKGTRGFSTGNAIPLVGTTTVSGVSLIKSAGSVLAGSTGAPFGVVLANLVNDGTNVDVLINALETKGLVRSLAEPNLVALSGETAKFLAGGEYPYPVIGSTSNGATTPSIEYKNYGVSLSFSPTVLNDGLINLRIAPEVSQLDFANAVTISGTTVPALVTRNAETDIELRDGQSFAIAGLLQNRDVRNINQIPWLGSVPVLGALLRSASYQKNESDLVIIVTPHLVRPGVPPADHLATPLDKHLPSNDVDFFVNGQTEVPKRYTHYVTSGGGLHGPYGYILNVDKGRNKPLYKGQVVK